jgi:hypothetical protein
MLLAMQLIKILSFKIIITTVGYENARKFTVVLKKDLVKAFRI